MTEQFNIESYCRVCMVQNPGELISLFEIHNSEDEVIANMIIDCTEVMVTDDDNLPQNICSDCLIRLNHAYELRKQCQRSDKAFRTMFLKVEQALAKAETQTNDNKHLLSLNENQDEAMDEIQEIEYLEDDDDFDEYVDLNQRIQPINFIEHIPAPIKKLLPSLSGSELVIREKKFHLYDLYYIKGERCCCCLKMFADIKSLQNHCDLEHGTGLKIDANKYQCGVCLQLFRSSTLLREHKKPPKVKSMYLCKLCKVVLEDEESFIKHIISTKNHGEIVHTVDIENKFETVEFKGLRCCTCNFFCAREGEIQKHMEEQHFSDPFIDTSILKCLRCFKEFNTFHALMLHKSKMKNMRSYVCRTEGCNYTTFRKREILEHITSTAIHQNILETTYIREKDDAGNCRYICCFARCCEAFDSYENLEHHAESVHKLLRIQHTLDRKFTQSICMICMKGFESEQAYERHRSSDRVRKHVCLKCGAQYVSKSTLLQHERSECGKVAQHQCSQCDKTFVSLGGLRNHQEVHSEERPHVCGTCGRGFLRKGILKDHINTVHSTIRLFQCSLCPKSFTSRNVFQSHQMTHTKEKPYQCRHCEKRYYKTSDRTMHENQVHLGIRPFQCNFCTASFIRDRERRLHERTHTKTKLYNCDMCSVGYNKFADYKLHRLDEHGLETLRDLGPATMAAVHVKPKQAPEKNTQ